MSPIVTDVERASSHSAPRFRSARLLRRVSIPVLTVVTVWSSTVVIASRPAVGDTIAGDQAKAAAIEAQLAQSQAEMSALGQQYDAASYHLSKINSNIATTKAAINADESQVASDKKALSAAAVSNYITDGAATTQNPIFSDNDKTLGAATEYDKIAQGDVSLAVDNLHTAENTLSAQQTQLQSQQSQAQTQVNTEQQAITQNQQAEQQQSAALAQEKGQIAQLVQQQEEAEAAAAARAAAQKEAAAQAAAAAAQAAAQAAASSGSQNATLAGLNDAAPPPTAAGGEGAVQAAESQVGVPYVWGAESPKGSADPGFDCSGLTAWSWGQVGVGLPHYSGAQMSDSTPVPLSDLEPGDLLFYGPGGDEHVAMYVSPGTMVEAPETGEDVHVTGIRLGGDFVGAGRP
jgi:peptidoglycan DL-endopeptidase CwlO